VLATTFSIDELSIPASIDGADAAEFIEMVNLRNALEAQIVGSNVFDVTAAELLPVYQAQEFAPKRIFVARVDGRMVGRAVLDWSIAHDATSSWVTATVLGEFRRRGIGSALFTGVESLALGSGRPIVQAEIVHTWSPGGERLASPTGFGDLSLSDPGVRFLRHRGYRLEQIERLSFLDLPLDESVLQRQLRDARTAAGRDYSLCSWVGPTPTDRIADLAWLRTRMSVDAPTAGLAIAEEPWDAARIARDDEIAGAGGQTRLTIGVLHRPTRRLVGFSELMVPADRSRPVRQGDTLVLSEHRGHRLGMLLKAGNLLELAAVQPRPPYVYTVNAEENRHMLNVNEAVGFRAAGQAGCWRRQD
jgi:GNAT superfamily N-acetyltransferase